MYQFKSLSEFHRYSNLPKPEHPLISLVDYSKVNYPTDSDEIKWVQDFYSIGLKRNVSEKFNYGQQPYDFNEGVLSFVAPQQILNIQINQNIEVKSSGWLLLIHPDFLWNTPLAKIIKNYDFFGYAVNEALFLSEKEENIIIDILKNIQREYQANIDKFSENIIITQVELLLNYAERYYERQFITRKINNHQILVKLEEKLDSYFNSSDILINGVPTVTQVANDLNLSPNYLSSMLKVISGQSTQQHIQNKIIEKAKEKLSTNELSISEIAYELGFEYPQSFSKLFKQKTNQSPMAFRARFN
ncbi:helix-turn-helix domain-containing protein [Mesonia oceanica]|uniref:Arabinose operon regulatory protein n=1 Tax=Mesonia oceanica TaxID=2687242 RepID=A0AC61YDI3_9FLAO|nr:response regulator transcription factor [Mesonia oceanica]MAQ40941.1 AraC family transcriptional regulator [Mesonia sp.]MBJ98404.1 AraC family transcriptional regulator [Flavobacteriaceae bacterium]VVV02305.1 Arabinose operon regulatory protein [Mesonia oceanica]|tara:strand:- start:7723 stop:8628 length:906 start_codon:yes stop_codon:yes gene_type:complete